MLYQAERQKEIRVHWAGSLPRIVLSGKRLSILMARDGDQYCAYCPELDLVTEMDTQEEAMADILEAMREYAEEYLQEIALYSVSPNRAHHLPYVKDIVSCKTDWESYENLPKPWMSLI